MLGVCVPKPDDFGNSELAFLSPQSESILCQSLQDLDQVLVMFCAFPMHYYIILYLHHALTSVQHQPGLLLALIAGGVHTHGESLVLVQAPGCVECA